MPTVLSDTVASAGPSPISARATWGVTSGGESFLHAPSKVTWFRVGRLGLPVTLHAHERIVSRWPPDVPAFRLNGKLPHKRMPAAPGETENDRKWARVL